MSLGWKKCNSSQIQMLKIIIKLHLYYYYYYYYYIVSSKIFKQKAHIKFWWNQCLRNSSIFIHIQSFRFQKFWWSESEKVDIAFQKANFDVFIVLIKGKEGFYKGKF